MEDLFKLVGKGIDVIRNEGIDHSHFRETVIILRSEHIIASKDTTIRRGDTLFVSEEKYRVYSQISLRNSTVFEVRTIN